MSQKFTKPICCPLLLFFLKTHCFLCFLCAVEPEQQPQEEKQPSPGIWEEEKQKCLISLKLWLYNNSSHSLLFLFFPLHFFDSQQKIDSGKECIVGDVEAFLSCASLLLAAKTRLLSDSEDVFFRGRNLQQWV